MTGAPGVGTLLALLVVAQAWGLAAPPRSRWSWGGSRTTATPALAETQQSPTSTPEPRTKPLIEYLLDNLLAATAAPGKSAQLYSVRSQLHCQAGQ